MPKPTHAAGTVGATYDKPLPKGVDPAVWALASALAVAARRLPYAAAEARLLDGLARWVSLAARGHDATAPAQPRGGLAERRLRAAGPDWAAVTAAVTAVARLVSPEAQALLAPWVAGVAGAPPAPGVSPHADAAADFLAGEPRG